VDAGRGGFAVQANPDPVACADAAFAGPDLPEAEAHLVSLARSNRQLVVLTAVGGSYPIVDLHHLAPDAGRILSGASAEQRRQRQCQGRSENEGVYATHRGLLSPSGERPVSG
jgi:hypothetical protein